MGRRAALLLGKIHPICQHGCARLEDNQEQSERGYQRCRWSCDRFSFEGAVRSTQLSMNWPNEIALIRSKLLLKKQVAVIVVYSGLVSGASGCTCTGEPVP